MTPQVQPSATSTCRGCPARIWWVLTVGGKRMPLDPIPTSDGSVVVEVRPDATVRARVLTGSELPAEGPAYRPHWQTCPSSETFRRRQVDHGPKCGLCRLPLDRWLVDEGYTRHVGCLPTPRPPDIAPAVEPVPVVHEQGALFNLGGGA